MTSVYFNGCNLCAENWGVLKLEMGSPPARGDNPVPIAVDGRFYVPKYKDELNTVLYMWVRGEDNLIYLKESVFPTCSGLKPYIITIGNTTYEYEGEVKDLRFALEAPSGFARLVVNIDVPVA